MHKELQQAKEALEAARQFIKNGIGLGFIRMPDLDTPDPAHDTPRKIAEALAALNALSSDRPSEGKAEAWRITTIAPPGRKPLVFLTDDLETAEYYHERFNGSTLTPLAPVASDRPSDAPRPDRMKLAEDICEAVQGGASISDVVQMLHDANTPDRLSDAKPAIPAWLVTRANEVVRELETARPPDIVLKQIQILGKMANLLREVISAGLSTDRSSDDTRRSTLEQVRQICESNREEAVKAVENAPTLMLRRDFQAMCDAYANIAHEVEKLASDHPSDAVKTEMLALLIESQEVLSDDWWRRRDAIVKAALDHRDK